MRAEVGPEGDNQDTRSRSIFEALSQANLHLGYAADRLRRANQELDEAERQHRICHERVEALERALHACPAITVAGDHE